MKTNVLKVWKNSLLVEFALIKVENHQKSFPESFFKLFTIASFVVDLETVASESLSKFKATFTFIYILVVYILIYILFNTFSL